MASESPSPVTPEFQTPTGTPTREEQRPTVKELPQMEGENIVGEPAVATAAELISATTLEPPPPQGANGSDLPLPREGEELAVAAMEQQPVHPTTTLELAIPQTEETFLSDEESDAEQPAFLVAEEDEAPPPEPAPPQIVALAEPIPTSPKERGSYLVSNNETEEAEEEEQVQPGALVLSGEEEDEDGFVLIGDDSGLFNSEALSGSYAIVGSDNNQQPKTTTR